MISFKLTEMIFILTLVIKISALGSSQISQKCHCDITALFCDFGCCCDPDCNSPISGSCFYGKSSFYCPNTHFFKNLKPSQVSQNVCYYYNSSSTIIKQSTLTNAQRSVIVSKGIQLKPASIYTYTGYKGYQLSTIVSIGAKTAFSFKAKDGSCNNSSSPNTASFSFKFGQNTKISCKCSSCGTPLLFSEIMGKAIPRFQGVSGDDITIPTISDSSITALKVNFVLGKYGSQKLKFIEKITISYQSNGSEIRSLYFNFIDSDTIKEQQNSATFFPQIPIDMFYPIHIMS